MRSYKDRVKLSSEPPGSSVFIGDEVIGKTPGFFHLRRAHVEKLVLKKDGYKPADIRLKTSYRWVDSFFSNMIFFYFAPIGWGVDLFTRTAWDYDNPPIIVLTADRNINAKATSKTHYVISISPPIHENEIFSSEVGQKLHIKIKEKFPDAKVLPYKSTETQYANYEYTNKKATSEKFFDDLSEELGATHILRSTVTIEGNDTIIVEAALFNVFTEKTQDTFKIVFSKNEFNVLKSSGYYTWLLSKISIVPNSIAFDLSPSIDSVVFTTSDSSAPYTSSSKDHSFALKYLSRISLRNLTSSRVRSRFGFNFEFKPIYIFSFNKLYFYRTGGGDFNDNELKRYGLNAGIGPEIGFELPFGYLYFYLAPCLGYQTLILKEGNSSSTNGKISITSNAEIGYSFFITKNLNARLFSRAVSYDEKQIEQLLEKFTSHDVSVKDSLTTQLSISLGYFFPQGRNYLKKFLY